MPLKILLADDNMTAQNMGRKILVDAGYDVVAVSNGPQALRKFAEWRADLVVLDVFMPGYSGLEVCEKIKTHSPNVPVLLTVGKMEPFRPEDGRNVKADGIIVKPFEATDLIAAVRTLSQGGKGYQSPSLAQTQSSESPASSAPAAQPQASAAAVSAPSTPAAPINFAGMDFEPVQVRPVNPASYEAEPAVAAVASPMPASKPAAIAPAVPATNTNFEIEPHAAAVPQQPAPPAVPAYAFEPDLEVAADIQIEVPSEPQPDSAPNGEELHPALRQHSLTNSPITVRILASPDLETFAPPKEVGELQADTDPNLISDEPGGIVIKPEWIKMEEPPTPPPAIDATVPAMTQEPDLDTNTALTDRDAPLGGPKSLRPSPEDEELGNARRNFASPWLGVEETPTRDEESVSIERELREMLGHRANELQDEQASAPAPQSQPPAPAPQSHLASTPGPGPFAPQPDAEVLLPESEADLAEAEFSITPQIMEDLDPPVPPHAVAVPEAPVPLSRTQPEPPAQTQSELEAAVAAAAQQLAASAAQGAAKVTESQTAAQKNLDPKQVARAVDRVLGRVRSEVIAEIMRELDCPTDDNKSE